MKKATYLLGLLAVVVAVFSCEKEYDRIGENLVNEDHFAFNLKSDYTIESSSFVLQGDNRPVQTNNLPYNVLGVYKDPVYGLTEVSLVSQVGLKEYGRDYGESPTIKKVVLSVPYFSRKTATAADGAGTYELDSIYGTEPMSLKIQRSDYFINDFGGANLEERRKYYSNDDVLFNGKLIDPALYESTSFKPSADELTEDITNSAGQTETVRYAPQIRETLDNAAFSWIFDPANKEHLVSANNFKSFYKGIYFTATANAGDGNLFGLDLSRAKIIITYDYTENAETKEGTVEMLFTGNRFNMVKNTFNPGVPNETDDKLYLKGLGGSMATIKLFGPDADNNGVADELEVLRSKKDQLLINEANLEFFVDQNSVQGGDSEPSRIFIMDLKNSSVLLDYIVDNSSSSDVNFSKIDHLGRLERDASGKGVKYKIKITEHINSIVKKDSSNVDLGIFVSNNVTLLGLSDIKDSATGEPKSILASGVVAHRGTVLHSENATDDSKKLKLKIYYTEPE